MINVKVTTTNNNTTYANPYVNPEAKINVKREIVRGDIFYINLDGFVKEGNNLQRGIRPAICTSNLMCNSKSPVITGVVFTTQVKNNLPTHVYFEKNTYGLTENSTALCEGIISIPKKFVLEYIGHIEDDKMREIDNAMKIQLQIKDEVCVTPIKEVPNDIEKFNKAKKLLAIVEDTDFFILNYEPRKIEDALKRREMQIAEFRIYCKEQNINSFKIYDEMGNTHKINMLYRDKKVMMG